MKKKRFPVEQIVAVLKQAELGVPVAEVIRKVGNRPSDAAPKALELFSEHILQHRFIQTQIGNQLLQSAILFLQLLHLTGLAVSIPTYCFFPQ
jgi:hypothetical protein